MLPLIVENHAHGALADFERILVRFLARDAPTYSGVEAFGKPGAFYISVQAGLVDEDEPFRVEVGLADEPVPALHQQAQALLLQCVCGLICT